MRRFLVPLLAVSLLVGPPAVAQHSEPEIWFYPLGGDIYNLWSNDAPWQNAASKVNDIGLIHWWIREQSDATLLQIYAFAKQHHLRIHINFEPVARFVGDTCGNEEGYMSIGDMTDTVNTLVRLGIRPDSVDMDGPVSSGSYDTSVNGCRYSIPALVTHVAMTMNYVVAAWPGIKIVEIEPVPALMQTPTWRQDETAFHIGLGLQIGDRVQGMMTDVQWQNPAWQQAMMDEHAYLTEQNMSLAVIYDGNATTTNNTDWINSAVSNFEAVEGTLHIIPDQAIFTSWNAYPQYNMPETSPTALTWLINRYPLPRSELEVQFVGGGANGKLTALDGKPIVNATVNGYIPGVVFSQPLPVTVMTGVVPASAVTALIGVRVNAECSCAGINDLLIGTITYQETQGGSLRSSYALPTASGTSNGAIVGGEMVGGTLVARVISLPGQALLFNQPALFPVTANAQYQFSIPAGTVGGSGWYGNVILIFVDAQGNGTRVTVVPGPGKALVSSAVTAADGTFALFPMPRAADGPGPVTVEFDGGGGTYRSTVWTPLQ
jgi:hypothetical protein